MTEKECRDLVARIKLELPEGAFALCSQTIDAAFRGRDDGWSVYLTRRGPNGQIWVASNITTYRQCRNWIKRSSQ